MGKAVIKQRRFHAPEALAEIYANPYDPHRWPEHSIRITCTTDIAQRVIDEHGLKTVADLSCGDGSIAKKLSVMPSFLSDGQIEIDIDLIDPVDLFIFTETMEHLEAPWTILEKIAMKTKWIVLSTPLDEDPAIGNYEHYWSFTETDVHSILLQSGFVDIDVAHLSQDGWTYTYQIWTARSIHA